MPNNQVFKIEIINWNKYNQKKKRGHESILLSCRFFDDAKIMRLTPYRRLIYIRLLLVAGDFSSSSIEVHPEMIARSTGVPRQIIVSSLFALQQNQLVTIINAESLKEENIKEENIKEYKRTPKGKGFEKDHIETQGHFSKKENANLSLLLSDQRSAPPQNKLVEIWNENCGNLPRVKTISKTRDRKTKAIFKSISEPEWIEVIRRLSKSDFCNGKNDRGWVADFDFLLKPETYSRTLEGRYDNRNSNFGKTEDGRYLTNAVKRSHNNKIMIEKYLKKPSLEEVDSEQTPRTVSPDPTHS